MDEVSGLKLIILYDAAKNTYRVLAHNFTSEEVERFLAEWNPHLIEMATILALTQKKRHTTSNPEDCDACRKAVKTSSGLSPMPKFTRRKK